ncbi:MAG TPA: DUF4270 domain-containing protein [Muricauda sp.]|nr:DUF4270 family protein [uncultured Allomuricauda sp.]MAO17849.1 hypothetical protein [Allomuricauda sp.]MBC72445.1 hypothetical protein [Allomuricauda sp.]HBU78207.1 DUF4270 domain-containing protein [Allomuricauda sp.]
MRFSNIFKVSALFGTLFLLIVSCEEELDTIGEGVIDGEPFTTGKVEYDVFAYNKGITAVQTNRLPVYQLGTFNDPIYGQRKASIISQLQLTTGSPTFGDLSQANEDDPDNDQENETVKEVFLNIPFLTAPSPDRDGDGVPDDLENGDDADDPNSDWDGDGVSDNQERIIGSDPYNPDEDGTGDNFTPNVYPNRFDLDSIYGDRNQTFDIVVSRSNYFLRDLDPNSNFQQAQEYYSNQDFSSFIGEELTITGENTVIIDDIETVVMAEDDPDTDVDESKTVVDDRIPPGIHIPLNPDFFQQNILDKEGQSELLNNSNFKNFLRGVHLTGTDMEELMFLLDLTRANITITYTYDDYDAEAEETVTAEKDFVLNFLISSQQTGVTGNAVNVFENEMLPPEVVSAMDNGENASRIYVKGGAAVTEVRLFDEVINGGEDIINQIKQNSWIINEANLVFYVDQEAVDASVVEPPRLYIYNAETNRPIFDASNEDPTINGGTNPFTYFLNHGGFLEEENNRGVKYKIRITEHINNIIVRDSTNARLGLTLTPNINIVGLREAIGSDMQGIDYPVAATVSPLGTVLYGSNVPNEFEDKKLKLEIFYTQAN